MYLPGQCPWWTTAAFGTITDCVADAKKLLNKTWLLTEEPGGDEDPAGMIDRDIQGDWRGFI